MTRGAADRQQRHGGRIESGRSTIAASLPAAVALLIALLGPAAATPARASAVDVLFGASREQGAFLGDEDVDLDEAFLSAEFGGTTSRLIFTVPYVRMSRTGLLTMTPEGPAVIGAGGPGRPVWQESDPEESEGGFGDIVVRSQNYVMKSGPGNRPTLTFDVDYKWATADESKGLGTGVNDWGVGLDYTQPLGKRLQILGRALYRFTGSPEGFDFEDRLFLRAGFGIMTSHTSWRLLYETVDPITKQVPLYDDTGAAIGVVDVENFKAVRGEAVFRNNAGGSLKLWGLAGLNDSSPDLGFGLTFASRAL